MRPEIIAVPITPTAVDEYGIVLDRGGDASRSRDERPDARLSIEVVDAAIAQGSIEVRELERHPTSVQAFFPMNGTPYLIVVCRSSREDKPDLNSLKAFLVPGDTVIEYRPGIWHAPIRSVFRPGRLGMVVNKAGTPEDCEFVPVPPFQVKIPAPECRSHAAP